MELRSKFLNGVSWQENGALMAIATSPQALDELVMRMKDANTGLPQRDRSGFFSSIKVQCFTGEDGINWLIAKARLAATRPEATSFFDFLLSQGVVTAVSVNAIESYQDSSSLYHLEGRAAYRGMLLSRCDPHSAWSTNLFVLRGAELYMFDNPLHTQLHSKYDSFINVAEAFVGVCAAKVEHQFCFQIATPTKVFQLAAETFAEMQNWLSNLGRIVQENLGAENRIIDLVDDLIAQREADLCDDYLAELENTEAPQRVVLMGTGTPPSPSPLVARHNAMLEVSRSPDEDHASSSLLHRQAVLRSSSSAATRSFETLPVRGSPRPKHLSRSPQQPPP